MQCRPALVEASCRCLPELSLLAMTHMPALFLNRVQFRRMAYGATELSESLLLVAPRWGP